MGHHLNPMVSWDIQHSLYYSKGKHHAANLGHGARPVGFAGGVSPVQLRRDARHSTGG